MCVWEGARKRKGKWSKVAKRSKGYTSISQRPMARGFVMENIHHLEHLLSFTLVIQMVKNLPVTQDAQVQSLGWEDPNPMATHSSILAWRIPWTEESSRLQFRGLQRVGHN